MQRYKIIIEYFGTPFVGWQMQKTGLSVQGVIEEAIYSYTKQQVFVYAAGRTDAGVHAKGQVGHFDLEEGLEPIRLMKAINHFMRPHKVAILSCEKADNDFHARFSATKRHYEYIILNRKAPSVIDENRVWYVHAFLNLEKMQQAASYLVGHHDFSSFRAGECQAKSPFKTLEKIEIIREGDYVKFYLSAISFLHHMVRNIVGTIRLVGEGKIPPEDMKRILEAKNRVAAGITASPDGLYFMRVDYK